MRKWIIIQTEMWDHPWNDTDFAILQAMVVGKMEEACQEIHATIELYQHPILLYNSLQEMAIECIPEAIPKERWTVIRDYITENFAKELKEDEFRVGDYT